jgi:hypothetical protein
VSFYLKFGSGFLIVESHSNFSGLTRVNACTFRRRIPESVFRVGFRHTVIDVRARRIKKHIQLKDFERLFSQNSDSALACSAKVNQIEINRWTSDARVKSDAVHHQRNLSEKARFE